MEARRGVNSGVTWNLRQGGGVEGHSACSWYQAEITIFYINLINWREANLSDCESVAGTEKCAAFTGYHCALESHVNRNCRIGVHGHVDPVPHSWWRQWGWNNLTSYWFGAGPVFFGRSTAMQPWNTLDTPARLKSCLPMTGDHAL